MEDLKNDPEVDIYITRCNEHLKALGYTEHGFRHVGLVANIARNLLAHLGFEAREAELGAIAGYLHDIGNVVNRDHHGQTSASITWNLLRQRGMAPGEVATVIAAIGNHEEEYGQAVNATAAALILADKSDVHFTRVQNKDLSTFDIHDRVNYAVKHSFLRVEAAKKVILLELTVDTGFSPVMDYFEIFLTRMVMCRRAATFLDCRFELSINDVRLL